MTCATKMTAAARGVCLKPGYGFAAGAFEPFAAAANSTAWRTIATWEHTVEGGCEALMSLRFAVFSRLSSADVPEAISASQLRRDHTAPSGGFLRAEVSVTRKSAGASKTFLVGAGGIDVFGQKISVDLMAPPEMRSAENAEYPLPADGLGALEEVWMPILGEDGASLRLRGLVHTYCSAGVAAPVPPSATHYAVMGPGVVTLAAGAHAVAGPSSGPALGYQTITVDADAVVAWEVEP